MDTPYSKLMELNEIVLILAAGDVDSAGENKLLTNYERLKKFERARKIVSAFVDYVDESEQKGSDLNEANEEKKRLTAWTFELRDEICKLKAEIEELRKENTDNDGWIPWGCDENNGPKVDVVLASGLKVTNFTASLAWGKGTRIDNIIKWRPAKCDR